MSLFLEGSTITSEDDLRGMFDEASELSRRKIIHSLDQHCKAFIAASPFIVISTSDATGSCDASPRGDAPGFVSILDQSHLLIPERPGNRIFDSLRNILSNPHIGILFIIPGVEETLRVNGRACIVNDEQLLNPLAVRGKSPSIGIGITVQECYLHCAKSLKRSQLWHHQAWEHKPLPSAAKILSDHSKSEKLLEQDVQALLNESYTQRMY